MARPEGAKSTIPSRRDVRRYALELQAAAENGDPRAQARLIELRILSDVMAALCTPIRVDEGQR